MNLKKKTKMNKKTRLYFIKWGVSPTYISNMLDSAQNNCNCTLCSEE